MIMYSGKLLWLRDGEEGGGRRKVEATAETRDKRGVGTSYLLGLRSLWTPVSLTGGVVEVPLEMHRGW